MKRLAFLSLLAATAALAGDVILRNGGAKVAPVSQLDAVADGGISAYRAGAVGKLYCSAAGYEEAGCLWPNGTQEIGGNKNVHGVWDFKHDGGIFAHQVSQSGEGPLDLYSYGIDNSPLTGVRLGSYESSTSNLDTCLIEVGKGFNADFIRATCINPLGWLWTSRVNTTVLDAGYAGIGFVDAGTLLVTGAAQFTKASGDALDVAGGGYAKLRASGAGAPTSGDCDAADEKGRVYIDTTNHRFYWCEGTAGWKYAAGT